MDQKAPDHSTLTVFRERLVKRDKLKVFEEILEIVQIALQSGIEFGSIQIVDSVHSIANVNTDKDRNRKNKGDGPRSGCSLGVKHKKKLRMKRGRSRASAVFLWLQSTCQPECG